MSYLRTHGLPLLLAVLALLATAAVTLIPVSVDAASSGCQAVGATTIYYNKANGGHEVGRYSSDCQGNCTGSGAITPYYEVTLFLPCPPPQTEP